MGILQLLLRLGQVLLQLVNVFLTTIQFGLDMGESTLFLRTDLHKFTHSLMVFRYFSLVLVNTIEQSTLFLRPLGFPLRKTIGSLRPSGCASFGC